MPNYEYQCKQCQYQFETSHSIHSDYLTKCPQCNENELAVIVFAVPFLKGGTVGAMADRNTRRMGVYEKDNMILKQKEQKIAAQKQLQEKLDRGVPGAKVITNEM